MPSGTWIRVPALRSPFGPDLVCHRGSDWFTLSRRAVEVVDRVARERPDLLRHYRRTLIPTEAFVQTVLANRSSLRLDGDIRRFTLWDAASPGPRIPRMGDLERIVDSGGDFARKFDETVDGAVLDEIDRRVHTT
jgi:Core-2/I-Branching enzyme